MAGKARAMAWAMVEKFPDCLYFVPNHVDSFRYVLHLPDCLYLVPNHVYTFRYVLHLPDCLYLVPNPVYSFRYVLHLPVCLYLVPNYVISFRNVLHLSKYCSECLWFPTIWHHFWCHISACNQQASSGGVSNWLISKSKPLWVSYFVL